MKPQLYTENYRQLRNAENRRNVVFPRRVYQLVIQYQEVSPQNIQVTLCRLYLRVCVCVHISMQQHLMGEAMSLKRTRRGKWGKWKDLEGRKERRK